MEYLFTAIDTTNCMINVVYGEKLYWNLRTTEGIMIGAVCFILGILLGIVWNKKGGS
jgi:hypothetical protein